MYQPEPISAKLLDTYVGRPYAVIIDLREPALYQKSHITGAINLSVEELEEGYSFQKGKILVFYCEHGIAGAKAAKLMSRRGYETRTLIGGFSDYHGRNLVILKNT